MPSVAAFRVSFYGTLGLACTCLAQASSFFVPWMWLLLLVACLLLAVAYRLEGRWCMSDVAANRLGVVILVVAGAWILLNLPRNGEDLQQAGVSWPAGLLPYLGPLLVVLLLVKLFRPKRQGDFWPLQTIGLMMVTLACVLAGEALFGMFLCGYLCCLMWCLANWHWRREQPRSTPAGGHETPLFAPGAAPGEGSDVLSSGGNRPWEGLWSACCWTCIVLALGGMMYFAAPRQGDAKWVPHRLAITDKGTLQTGLSMDGGIDLHHVGQVEVSDEPAFQVLAFQGGIPKLDLDPNIRWSVDTLDYYDHGHWNHFSKALTPAKLTWGLSSMPKSVAAHDPLDTRHPRVPPADLPANCCYFCFTVQPLAAGGLVHVDAPPVRQLGARPRINDFPTQASLFFSLEGTDTIFWSLKSRKRVYSYGQVAPARIEPAARPANVTASYVQFLLQQADPPEIVEWTKDLLTRLPEFKEAAPPLTDKGYVKAEDQLKVAQALCGHLAESGEFHYTLSLRRAHWNEDPTVDFLLNVKEGHCQRFASGLTHMLRSVGIPARLVLGYRGFDSSAPGAYVVRQSMAHSWVQALVPDDKTGSLQWLTLDPTPAIGAEEQSEAWLGWWPTASTALRLVWRDLVLEFNSDQQRQALAWFGAIARSSMTWIWAAACAFVFVVGRWALLHGWLSLGWLAAWRRQAVESFPLGQASFYARLLQVLDRGCRLRPAAGQTPFEFAQAAAQGLLTLGVDSLIADLTLPVAEAYYRVRYGGVSLSVEQLSKVDAQIESLRSALVPRAKAALVAVS